MTKDGIGAVSTANALKMAMMLAKDIKKGFEPTDENVDRVINACKEALEQPAQKPLSDDDIFKIVSTIEQIKPQYGMMLSNEWNILDFARAIEQAHEIGERDGQTHNSSNEWSVSSARD